MRIVCTNVGREPSKSCYKECVIAYKCGALQQWEKENDNSWEDIKKGKGISKHIPCMGKGVRRGI